MNATEDIADFLADAGAGDIPRRRHRAGETPRDRHARRGHRRNANGAGEAACRSLIARRRRRVVFVGWHRTDRCRRRRVDQRHSCPYAGLRRRRGCVDADAPIVAGAACGLGAVRERRPVGTGCSRRLRSRARSRMQNRQCCFTHALRSWLAFHGGVGGFRRRSRGELAARHSLRSKFAPPSASPLP